MGSRRLARAAELVREGPEQDVRDKRALARPGDARDGYETTQRERHVDVLEVMLARSADDQRLPAAVSPRSWDLNHPLPAQVRPCYRARLGQDRLQRADRDDLAAVLPRPGPDVDDPVGGADRLLVVFDDQDRVAEIPQPGERGDQLCVVALVQADRRLVEDVQDAHQAGPDLRGQSDALGLAAGQRLAGAIERQVIEPHVDEEAKPGRDLLQDLAGDGSLALRQPLGQMGDPLAGRRDRQLGDMPDVPAVDRDGEDLRLEPPSLASRARPGDHVALQLRLDEVRVRLAEAALQIGNDAFEGGVVRVLAAFVAVADDHPLAAPRIEDVLQRLGRQVLDGGVVVPAVLAADGFDDPAVPGVLHLQACPGHQRPACQRQVPVGHDALRIYLEAAADAGAARAGAMRRIEAEAAGLELVHGSAVVGAAVPLAVAALRELRRLPVARYGSDQDHSLAQPQGRLDRVGQAS